MKAPAVLFVGRRFRVEQVTELGADGKEHVREVVRHPGAVVILPLVEGDRVCLIRNYRAAVGETLWELPAGTLEPNEDPQTTACRELAEETGYRAGKMELLTVFYTTPGILDERMYMFLAQDLLPGPTALEAGENLQPVLCDWKEVLQLLRDGNIRDGKTIATLLYYHVFHRRSTEA